MAAPFLPHRRQLKKQQFLEVFRRTGVITTAAEAIHVNRNTIWEWRLKDSEFDRAVEDCLEDCVDDVESALFDKAKNGDTIAQIFYLKARRPIFRDRLTLDIPAMQSEIKERMQRVLANHRRPTLLLEAGDPGPDEHSLGLGARQPTPVAESAIEAPEACEGDDEQKEPI